MLTRIPVMKSSKTLYEIVIENDFNMLAQELKQLGLKERKVCIVTDSNILPLYASKVSDCIKNEVGKIVVFTMEAGEQNKTLNTVQSLYKFLIDEKFDRKDILIALGGGVVGDLTGFTAATYLRGIDFIQIPTTLLSQTDSSIGGKTGVDFEQYKNMVGAFCMPKLVYMNMSTLLSLSDRQFSSGMAEILKHGLIKDARYYEWLIENFPEILNRETDILEEMIRRSCEIKRAVVEKDPTEQGERALLNFGHTIGHAIEKYMDFKLLHGECVALGCVAAAYISYKHNLLSEDEYFEIRDMFVPFSLPISLDSTVDAQKICELTLSDKKVDGNKIKFILLKKIGKAVIDTTVTQEEILSAVNEIIYKEKG